MDGRSPRAYSLGNQTCDDIENEENFIQWYQHYHFSHATESGIYHNPSFFINTRRFGLPQDEGKFLVAYEIYRHDLEQAVADFSKFTPTLQADYNKQKGSRRVFGAVYSIKEREFNPKGSKRSNSVLLMRIECTDPKKVDEMLKWYAETHLPEATSAGIYHTGVVLDRAATRAAAQLPANTSQHLALYESELGSAAVIAEEFLKKVPTSKYPPYIKVNRVQTFYRASP